MNATSSAYRAPHASQSARCSADGGSSGSPRPLGEIALDETVVVEVTRTCQSRFASEEPAQLARGAKQVDADRRFVESRHRADFPRRAVAVVAEHEDGALAAVEPIDRRGKARTPLAREQPRFGSRSGGPARRDDALRRGRRRRRRREPALAPGPRLPPVQAAVDENPREPDLERPRLAIRGDVAEHLDEGVLDGLVGVGGVAQVLIRDSRCARRW